MELGLDPIEHGGRGGFQFVPVSPERVAGQVQLQEPPGTYRLAVLVAVRNREGNSPSLFHLMSL